MFEEYGIPEGENFFAVKQTKHIQLKKYLGECLNMADLEKKLKEQMEVKSIAKCESL